MARLVTSGFETQKTVAAASAANDPEGQSLGTIGTLTANTANPRSGAACLAAAKSGQNRISAPITGVLDRVYYYRGAFRFASVSPSQTLFFVGARANAGATGIASMALNTSSKVVLRNEVAGVAIGTSTNALSINTWYVCEFKVMVPSSGNGTLNGRVLNDDGTVFHQFTEDTSRSLGTVALSDFDWGHNTAAESVVDLLIDDIAINDDQGTEQNSWCGPGKVVLLKPTGDNTVTGWGVG